MITEKEFILTIKSYPELYNPYKKHVNADEKGYRELWVKFAKENHFKSGRAAESKWRKLVSNYVSFLVYGTAFDYDQEMQFMQMPLLSAGFFGTDDTQSDSDIDEGELKRILDSSDEDCPMENKKQCIDLTDDGAEAPNKFDYGEKNEEHSIVTNVQFHDLQENTDSIESVSSEKNEEELRSLTDNNKNRALLVEEDASNSIGMIVAPVVEPPKISANCSNAAQSTPGSFTNLSSLELIFLGYAKVLQRMPLRLQLKTKRKIADIMDEAELQMLEEK